MEGALAPVEMWLEEGEQRGEYWGDEMVFEPLPKLGRASLEDIRLYLVAQGCKPSLAKDVAGLIFTADGGHYEETQKRLRRGADPTVCWEGLRDELKDAAASSGK